MQHPPREVCKWLGKHFPNLRLAYGGEEQAYLLIQLIPQKKYGTYGHPRTLKTPWFCNETLGELGAGLQRNRINRGLLYKKNGDVGQDFAHDQIPVIECEVPPEVVFGHSEYKTLQFGDLAYIDKKRRDELWAKGRDLQQKTQDMAYAAADEDRYNILRAGVRAGGEMTASDRIESGRQAELNMHRSNLSDLYIKRGTVE